MQFILLKNFIFTLAYSYDGIKMAPALVTLKKVASLKEGW